MTLNKINLSDDLLLSKGGERFCYLHPNDHSKVIKIEPNTKIHRNQNKLDKHYYLYLVKSNKDLKYVAECFNFIETNIGRGLVFERILNYDGSPSHSLKYIIFHKKIEIETQRALLKKLLDYLWEQQIVFGDVYCDNIFCKEVSPDTYEFIIIDGLGARHFNYKYKLYFKFSLFRYYKIIKQAKKMTRYHENMVIEAKTTNPNKMRFY